MHQAFREHCIKLVQIVLQSTLSSFNDHNNHDHHHPDHCPQCPAYNAQSTLSHYPSHHDHHHSDRFPQCPAFFSKAFFLGNSWQLSCLQGELVKPVLWLNCLQFTPFHFFFLSLYLSENHFSRAIMSAMWTFWICFFHPNLKSI